MGTILGASYYQLKYCLRNKLRQLERGGRWAFARARRLKGRLPIRWLCSVEVTAVR